MTGHDLDPDLMSSLRAQGEKAPQPDWDAMEQRLLDAFVKPRVTADPRRWRWAAAAAALVLTAGALWQVASFDPPVPLRSSIEAPRAAAPEPPGAPAPILVPPMAVAAVPAPVPATGRVRAPRTRRAPEDPIDPFAQFAGFVTLPGAGALPDFESGHIVRIEVPIAGLPAYGLDLLPDAAPAAIEADLLVGQDGVPRAIRLASTNQLEEQ